MVVRSGGFDSSLLKVAVVVRSEGFSTPSLVTSFVVVFTMALLGGFDTSLGASFGVLGTASTSFRCPLCLPPSAFHSFPRIRISLCWMRGLSHTSGFSLDPAASLGLVESSCVIIPLSVRLLAGGSLSVNRSVLSKWSEKMGRGNIPGDCLGEGSLNPWSVGCLNLLRLVRTVCHSSDSSHGD